MNKVAPFSWPKSLILRDLTSTLLIAASAVWYGHNLNVYMQEIGHPWAIVGGFWVSLFIAIWHEWKNSFVRLSFAKIGATVLMFALTALLAQSLRQRYVEGLEIFWHQPEAIQMLGVDVVSALKTRVVGFGGCFGVALMLMRLLAYKSMQRAFIAGLVPNQSMPESCPHCGQFINHHPI